LFNDKHLVHGSPAPARADPIVISVSPGAWIQADVGLSRHGHISIRSLSSMTHVVAEPCFGCKYTDCVVVCPVECFYEGEKMLYIHPDECIDCEACVPECPVEAIFHQDNLPEEWKEFTALNAEMAPQCPVITEKKEPLAGKE
jgi:ferredoxin